MVKNDLRKERDASYEEDKQFTKEYIANNMKLQHKRITLLKLYF